jgi:rhamnulokinase
LYAKTLEELTAVRGRPFSCLHIVGGGSQNELLNQLCADACGVPVFAGPIEASTLGNIGCQLMALDEITDVDDFRKIVAASYELKSFIPHSDSEIARYIAQFPLNIQTQKEFCA